MKKVIVNYSWEELIKDVEEIERQLKFTSFVFKNIYGCPRGGLIPAVMLSHRLDLPLILTANRISDDTLIVDDISDTGKTLLRIATEKNIVATLWTTPHTKYAPHIFCNVAKKDEWIIFPFETLKSSKVDNK